MYRLVIEEVRYHWNTDAILGSSYRPTNRVYASPELAFKMAARLALEFGEGWEGNVRVWDTNTNKEVWGLEALYLGPGGSPEYEFHRPVVDADLPF